MFCYCVKDDRKALQRWEHEWGRKNRLEVKSQSVGSHKSTWRLCCTSLKIVLILHGRNIGAMRLQALFFETRISYPKRVFLQAKPHGKTSSATSHSRSFIGLPLMRTWEPSLYMVLPARLFFSPTNVTKRQTKAKLFLNSKLTDMLLCWEKNKYIPTFLNLILTGTIVKIMYRNAKEKSTTHQLCFFIGIQCDEGSTLSCRAHSHHKLALVHLLCLALVEQSHMDHWRSRWGSTGILWICGCQPHGLFYQFF